MKIIQTAERISHIEASDNVIYQRSVFAYHAAAAMVGKNILEIGTGMGYGLEIIAPLVETYTAVDKYASELVDKNKENKDFMFYQQTVPPLDFPDDEQFDTVISFQVIEHIKNDQLFAEEISRVLKSGGKVIITTPNRLMSITRNPWHIREYTAQQFQDLLSPYFSELKIMGIFGNEKTMAYYEENKKSVKRITRFDILNMQYWLPRQLLQIPYDILNRLNRKKLMQQNVEQLNAVSHEDYFLREADDNCFDLFAIGIK